MIFCETISVGSNVSSKSNFRNGCLKGKVLDHNSIVVSVSCHRNWSSFIASVNISQSLFSKAVGLPGAGI